MTSFRWSSNMIYESQRAARICSQRLNLWHWRNIANTKHQGVLSLFLVTLIQLRPIISYLHKWVQKSNLNTLKWLDKQIMHLQVAQCSLFIMLDFALTGISKRFIEFQSSLIFKFSPLKMLIIFFLLERSIFMR